MKMRIEDYGMVGDLQTVALISREGSVDWLCFPHFDSGACFAALLGDERHGRWLLQPAGPFRAVRRRYRPGTLILETELETDDGTVRLIDFMPPRDEAADLVRIVEGVEGRVAMMTDLTIRFDYGSVVPWLRRVDNARVAVAGPDGVVVRTPIDLVGRNFHTVGEFTVGKGDRVPFTLTWFPPYRNLPAEIDPEAALTQTESFWLDWVGSQSRDGEWHEAVERSLLTLKALTFSPTGGIVAAPTTSLPEWIGGVRNWDYRYCWLRDATLTLLAFLTSGYVDEARRWRDWFLRAIAGSPKDLQIMYAIDGQRRLTELELPWLPGYEGSRPVRIGNGASGQLQLDVYGEVIDALYQSRARGLEPSRDAWRIVRKLLDWLESGWRQPDDGIWEVRGGRRHFVHSKVMAWVAFDRGIRFIESFGRDGPVERWKALRGELHDEVCREGYDAERRTFVQSYGSVRLDASALMMPIVGFLPATDDRMLGTVAAIERELLRDGFVERYRADDENVEIDGFPPGEGVFLPCSFWLVAVLSMQGREADARRLFERLLALRNDLGLLSEEYDPEAKRLLGNFPQAFTHLTLVGAATQFSERRMIRKL